MSPGASRDVIAEIRTMMSRRGQNLYGGETITQMEHALQCGMLAEQAGASKELITAAFLHDIGHVLEKDFENAAMQGIDGVHEVLGADYLARWFGPEVVEPVRLHVPAKRYLCGAKESYLSALSPMAIRTLKLQGGPMSTEEKAEFEKNPGWREAARVRVWDDKGKVPDKATPDLEHFLAIAEQCLEGPGRVVVS